MGAGRGHGALGLQEGDRAGSREPSADTHSLTGPRPAAHRWLLSRKDNQNRW